MADNNNDVVRVRIAPPPERLGRVVFRGKKYLARRGLGLQSIAGGEPWYVGPQPVGGGGARSLGFFWGKLVPLCKKVYSYMEEGRESLLIINDKVKSYVEVVNGSIENFRGLKEIGGVLKAGYVAIKEMKKDEGTDKDKKTSS